MLGRSPRFLSPAEKLPAPKPVASAAAETYFEAVSLAELIADPTTPSCASALSASRATSDSSPLKWASSLANLLKTADDIPSFEALRMNGDEVLILRGLETKEVVEAALRAARRTKCL